jgi:hypothetical protein
MMSQSMSYINIVIHPDKKELIITGSYVPEFERGKGIASFLLKISARIASFYNISTIQLNDMSDGYRVNGCNVYTNNGFIYKDDVGPEMIGRTSIIKRS